MFSLHCDTTLVTFSVLNIKMFIIVNLFLSVFNFNLYFLLSAPATLCPVEAPGVLKFTEVCCVGISKKELLPLKNPTDRWMECIIQVC